VDVFDVPLEEYVTRLVERVAEAAR
jgi:hypothetical protein